LTTHYTRVCKNLKKEKRIALFKMDVDVSERGKFEYTYKMKLGVSEIEGAVKILREMNYPEEIIDGIQ
jgi:DNA mismatch repair ATPase MutS